MSPIHMIRDIIKNKYDAPYLSWKKIPKLVRDIWFGEFQVYLFGMISNMRFNLY
ncbi:hypothetical protein MA16_Dca008197 [Dendrobium catenatum]|uniref:Uncharacterized protein n=1 Tax=Dendrobium catenatum TaxID=906689 RepID=A0A2I0XA27_9ASPA|nr:hypothetical protein MA16_Dca008197 [Dendrobium catenatum]